jgi:hypothetical protein
LKKGNEDQVDKMNRAGMIGLIRGEKLRPARLALVKPGNVKYFVDKTDGILYPPHFICDGPTLWG